MGRLRPCCTINSVITDSKGEPYKIDRIGDLERFWHSDTMREIRKAGLENRWHKLCFKCEQQENGGSFSQRLLYVHLLEKVRFSKKSNPDSVIPNIKMLNLLLSNKCNMKCRMCSPKNSHLIGRESKTHNLSDIWGNDVWGKDQTSTYSEPVSIDDDAMIELVEAYHESIDEIQFAGGEPFLSDTQYLILKKLVDLGVSDKITITYNTNGTIPMDQYYELWSKFKKVSLSVSLEAVGDLANYIRYPTNWDNINRVMKSLDLVSNNIIQVKVNCLVQALNVLRLREFMEWLYQYDNICRIPSFSTLVLPKHQHIRNIPIELREESASNLKNFMETHDLNSDRGKIIWPYRWYKSRMKKTIHYIKNEPDAINTTEFIKFNTTLDRVRKLDLFAVLPELNGYYKI
jgi:molybdenum cofactor biosynthesis enzyme MoaA